MSQSHQVNSLNGKCLILLDIEVETLRSGLSPYGKGMTQGESDEICARAMHFIERVVRRLQHRGVVEDASMEAAKAAVWKVLILKFPEGGFQLAHRACCSVQGPQGVVIPVAPAANQGVVSSSPANRQRVDQFIEASAASGFKITRVAIWKAAGHSQPRQFQYWQNGDPRATASDARNFDRILAMSPRDFDRLRRKSKGRQKCSFLTASLSPRLDPRYVS